MCNMYKHISFRVFVLFVVSTLIGYAILHLQPYFIEYSSQLHDNLLTLYGNNPEPEFRNVHEKLILFYTGLHGKEHWPHVQEDQINNYLRKSRCNCTNCRITYRKDLLDYADVVIFHAHDMPRTFKLYEMKKYRPHNQRWLYFNSESPLHSPFSKPLNGLFHLTMSYKKDSDIFLPYGRYVPLKTSDTRPSPLINYAANRTKQVAWLVSNCKNARLQLAKKLEDYGVNINVGGKCVNHFHEKLRCGGCETELRKHKFYLAAENSFCTDYITEKYWVTPFYYDLVPIVFGGADYSDPRLAIPGSFIDALKFKSVKHLADYIKEVDNDDSKYNSLFKWKQKYKLWKPLSKPLTGKWPYESYFLCELCRILNGKPNKLKFYDMGNFWGMKENCMEFPNNFYEWIKK